MTEQELLNLYTRFSTPLPGIENIRAIDFNLFKAAAEVITHEAYVSGVTEGLDSMHDAVQGTLKGLLV
jgi:hypothetical protein